MTYVNDETPLFKIYSSFYLLTYLVQRWLQTKQMSCKDSYHLRYVFKANFSIVFKPEAWLLNSCTVIYQKKCYRCAVQALKNQVSRKNDLQEPWLTHSFWLFLVFLDQYEWMNEWRWCNKDTDDSNLIEWEFLNV